MTYNKRKYNASTNERNVKKRSKISISSLLDLSSEVVASNYSYQLIEEKLHIVPFPVQKRILFHAFPKNENVIALYSSNSIHVNVNEITKQPYHIAVKLVESNAVFNVIQIGYHLSGNVREKRGICNKQKTVIYKCSMSFDRNCITSTECSCNNKELLWCAHVVAVAVYRIRYALSVTIKPPISDTIVDLKNKQLQKLVLMLASNHKNEILRDIQFLLDDLKIPNSEINELSGLPDPTAGGCHNDEKCWHIDNESIKLHVKNGLLHGNISKNILSLMNKVREMISFNDENYLSLLISITDSILKESMDNKEIQNYQRTRRIYDELQSLWFCVKLNPNLSRHTDKILDEYLSQWFNNENCPKVNDDDTTSMNILESVINSIEKDDFASKAATIESNKLVNENNKSLKIAKQLLEEYRKNTCFLNELNLFDNAIEGVSILYNTFIENHLYDEALEWGLVCLCNSWKVPPGEYAQNRLSHRYEQFISELENLNYNNTKMKTTIAKYSKHLQDTILKSNKWFMQNLSNHCFVRFLLEKLIDIDHELAFSLSLLMLPLKKGYEDESNETTSYNGQTVYIQNQLEYQQSELAATLIKKCIKYKSYLKSTLNKILECINQFEHLFRLAKLCSNLAKDDIDPDKSFLNAAFDLGLKCLQLSTQVNDRKIVVRWLMTCAVELGKHAVLILISNWTEYFSPKEIANEVSPLLTSQPVLCKLQLDDVIEKDSFMHMIRNMVIEACVSDPVPVVLFAMTLCEDHVQSFELIYQICYDSQDRFNPAQLFSVARYLENKKHTKKAYKLAIQALKRIDLGPQDTYHPAVCDVIWFCLLASNLGIDELTQVVPIIQNCIRNPSILVDIAEKCSNPIYFTTPKHFCCNKEPLNRITTLAQKLFVEDVESRLQNLTRKNYINFIEYLKKIRKAFLLSDDGVEQFNWLIDYIMSSQKGKKKLHQSLKETFFL